MLLMKQQNNTMLKTALFQVSVLETAGELVFTNLQKVEGVAWVEPGRNRNQLTVTFDPSRIDPSQLESSLRQAGVNLQRLSVDG